MSFSRFGKALLVLCLCISVASCSASQGESLIYTELQQLNTTLQQDAIDLTETAADELFRSPDYYAMPLLTKHEVLADENTLVAKFYFKKAASLAEINNARSFVITKFVLWQQSKMGGTPYDELIKKQAKPEIVFCEIFLDDHLLMQDKYQGEEIIQYEQLNTPCDGRSLPQKNFETLAKPLQSQIPNAEIGVQKSLLGYCVIVTVKTANPVTSAQLKIAKSTIEAGLAQSEQQVIAYSGIVLRLVSGDKEYSEVYVRNSKKPRWLTDDWMNFSFIGEVNKA